MNDIEDDINSILCSMKQEKIQEQSIVKTNEIYVRESDNIVYIVKCDQIIVPIIL
jgi:hypothetical protein